MNYFDDILNVSAMLQDRARKNQQRSWDLVQSSIQLRDEFKAMNEEADELLETVRALAAAQGIDTSEIQKHYESLPTEVEPSDLGQLLVSLPPDYDFGAKFASLVEEAHQAGYTNVHPEDVLTYQEMAHAESFRKALDDRFAQATRLTAKDDALLLIAVALRCLCYYFFVTRKKEKEEKKVPPPAAGVGTAKATAVPAVSQPSTQSPAGSSPTTSAPSAALPTAQSPSTPAYTIDAASGVDMDSILKKAGTSGGPGMAKQGSSLGISGSDLLRAVTAGSSKTARIRGESQILHEQIPFDLPDNARFKHSDIAGFHPQLGWLIGVINLLTNTVTTYQLDTFSVVPSMVAGLPMQLGQELSTMLHVLLPVAQSCRSHRSSLLAAVAREADVLQVSKAPMEDVAAIMENTMYYEQQNKNVLSHMTVATDFFSIDLTRLIGDTGVTAFLDLLISAIHAIQYDPEVDGDKQFYAIRTNRILLISQVLATMLNSTRALFTENLMDIDMGGILMSFLKVLNSTSFWINVKTEYLVSEYKVLIDEENKKIDKYFR